MLGFKVLLGMGTIYLVPDAPAIRNPQLPDLAEGIFGFRIAGWDDDYDGWVVHYETSDERVPAEFRAWRAVWWDGHWQPAEV